jgi:hypothetical protein
MQELFRTDSHADAVRSFPEREEFVKLSETVRWFLLREKRDHSPRKRGAFRQSN